MATQVFGVICDLVFGSQIQEAITSSGFSYRSFRNSADIDQQLEQTTEDKVLWIVNLAAKSSSEPALIDNVLPKLIKAGCSIVCYAPHVEETRMAWAQSLGVQHVVPRGALIRTLGDLLA